MLDVATCRHAALLVALLACGGGAAPQPAQPIANQHGSAPNTTPRAPEGPEREAKVVAGEITVHPSARGYVTRGGIVFVILKRLDHHGQPTGLPLAVEKLAWAEPLTFFLTEEDALVTPTTNEPWGFVIVTARYDQDGDALTKQPGDVVGSTRVQVPAENATIVLDDVLR